MCNAMPYKCIVIYRIKWLCICNVITILLLSPFCCVAITVNKEKDNNFFIMFNWQNLHHVFIVYVSSLPIINLSFA